MSVLHTMPIQPNTQPRCGRRTSRAIQFPLLIGLLVGLLILLLVSPARAEHGEIKLQVMAPEREKEQTATSDQEPPVGGVKKPPVFEVRPDEPLVLQFFLTNLYPHGIIQNVTVRYYVIKTDRLGKKPRPELKGKEGLVTRGQVTMDFKPKCRVGARLQFRVPEPGLYSVRVETDSHGKRDHEHFSSIDLKAESRATP